MPTLLRSQVHRSACLPVVNALLGYKVGLKGCVKMAAESTLRIHERPVRCPRCGFYCHPQAASCPHCDTELPKPPTRPTTDDIEQATRFSLQKTDWNQITHTLAPEAPIVIEVLPAKICIPLSLRKPVILGRQVAPGDPSIMDLACLHALEFGVSRRHCQLQRTGHEIYATDLGSSNHSYINGSEMVPHKPYLVLHGSSLVLGRLYMHILFSLVMGD